jgi:hypothetical protein
VNPVSTPHRVAVRHADDHIHIVATLARADGVRPEVWNDGYRVRDACRAVEERFGLRSTAEELNALDW